MTIRKIIVFFALAGIISLAEGQEDKSTYVAHERAYHADDTAVVNGQRGVGWVRSHLFDDWFVEVQGGGQLYYGTDDRLGRFGDRLTGNGEVHFGRRIFPMFGFRLGLGGGYAHGFITKEHHAGLLEHGGNGQCGTDALGNSLGGYYWAYDGDDNLYIQKWKYIYFGADIFLDLGLLRGASNYNPYKKYNHFIYGGAHTKWGLSETDATNHRSEAHLGYILKRNITPNLGLLVDVRGSWMERRFDREWVPSVERAQWGLDFVLNAQVGVIYKFHMRDEDERNKFAYVDHKRVETRKTLTYYTFINREERVEETLIDSLLHYEMELVPTPETQQAIDSLNHVLDSLLNARKHRADGQPLDSILLNDLLPYEMVFFELDKWDILASEEMKIDKMARIMKAYPNETFILTGSADSKTGTPHRNDFLSHNRADIVYNELTTRYGIPASQLRREYLGGILDYQPFQLNRCTVIIMNHPAVVKAFNEMKQQGRAGGGEVRQ